MPCVWVHSQVGMNFALCLGLLFELIGVNEQSACKMKNRTSISAFADFFFKFKCN